MIPFIKKNPPNFLSPSSAGNFLMKNRFARHLPALIGTKPERPVTRHPRMCGASCGPAAAVLRPKNTPLFVRSPT